MKDFTVEEIRQVLDTAGDMKKIISSNIKKDTALRGKSIVNLFLENSTRTRTSFELAGKYLGADVVSINASTSSLTKGESLRDTLRTIEAMGTDAIVIRHSSEGSAEYASKCVKSVIINAGDGCHAHPSQALLDLFTIEQVKNRLTGLKVAIIGDIMHSRVARSDIVALNKFGNNEVHIAGFPTLIPDIDGVTIHDNAEDAIRDADVVIILRIQLERQASGLFSTAHEYSKVFGMNLLRIKSAKSDVLIMHPGPQNKGLEISSELVYCEKSAIREQVLNGVSVRMALLKLVLGG